MISSLIWLLGKSKIGLSVVGGVYDDSAMLNERVCSFTWWVIVVTFFMLLLRLAAALVIFLISMVVLMLRCLVV